MRKSENLCALHVDLLQQSNKTKFLFDTTSILTSNIQNGLKYNLNNFQKCKRFSINHPQFMEPIEGQYCLVEYFSNFSNRKFYSGLCYPVSCDFQAMKTISSDVVQSLGRNMSGYWCQNESSYLRPGDYVAIVFISIWILLIAASTFYDYIMTQKEKPPIKLYSTFSLYSNIKRIFKATNGSNSNVNSLYTIRTLSILWLIISDRFIIVSKYAVSNEGDYKKWIKNGFSTFVFASDLAYDSLFIVSGFLLSIYCFRAFSMKKFHFLPLLLHRYIRYVPLILVSIVYHLSLMKYFISGPLTHQLSARLEKCDNFWFASLFMLENYMGIDKMCLLHGWYFSIDFHFYIITPLFVYFCRKSRKMGFAVLGIITAFIYATELGIVVDSNEPYDIFVRDSIFHMYSHFRCVSWFSSIILATFCVKSDVTIRKKFRIINTMGAIALIILLLFFGYLIQNENIASTDVIITGIYGAFHRILWSLSICWLIFYCYHLEQEDFIQRLLNSPIMKPLARLKFSLLIVYPIYQISTTYSRETAYSFDSWEIFHTGLGDILMSIFIALILSAGVEMPFVLIERLCFERRSKGNPRKSKTVETTNGGA